MKAHRRLGIAVAVNVLVFVLLAIVGILITSSGSSSAIQVVLPEPDVAEALIRTRIISPALESDLQLNGNSRIAFATGPIACDEGERVRIRVIVTQQSALAIGEGHSQTFCTGEIQTWTVKVVAHGRATFEAGPAWADAWASTRRHGKVTDIFRWDQQVTLEEAN